MKTLFFLIVSMIMLNCSDDSNDAIQDLTSSNWKLISIKSQSETVIISEGSYVKKDSYVLRFTDNATFFLDTSVNAASGNYILDENNIQLNNYQELSEVSTNDEEQKRINTLLLENLGSVRRFLITQNELILIGGDYQFIFRTE